MADRSLGQVAERWVPIPDYEGLYEVSDAGHVKAIRRMGSPGGLLRPHVDNRGYRQINLHKQNRGRSLWLHQVVCLAFHGPAQPGQEVRHLDGNKGNNGAANLVWGTRSENEQDKIRHGTNPELNLTHCPSNHRYDEANTYVLPSRPNARYCRTCHREANRRYEEKRRRRGAAA